MECKFKSQEMPGGCHSDRPRFCRGLGRLLPSHSPRFSAGTFLEAKMERMLTWMLAPAVHGIPVIAGLLWFQQQQQQQQQGTNNHCGPVLFLCFYLILQTKTVAPCVVLPPPLEQPICNAFSLFLPISTNKDSGPVCCSDPPPPEEWH